MRHEAWNLILLTDFFLFRRNVYAEIKIVRRTEAQHNQKIVENWLALATFVNFLMSDNRQEGVLGGSGFDPLETLLNSFKTEVQTDFLLKN